MIPIPSEDCRRQRKAIEECTLGGYLESYKFMECLGKALHGWALGDIEDGMENQKGR